MIFLSLLLGTLACLAFPTTRIFGVLGGMSMFYFHPFLTLGLAISIGVAFYYYKEHFQ